MRGQRRPSDPYATPPSKPEPTLGPGKVPLANRWRRQPQQPVRCSQRPPRHQARGGWPQSREAGSDARRVAASQRLPCGCARTSVPEARRRQQDARAPRWRCPPAGANSPRDGGISPGPLAPGLLPIPSDLVVRDTRPVCRYTVVVDRVLYVYERVLLYASRKDRPGPADRKPRGNERPPECERRLRHKRLREAVHQLPEALQQHHPAEELEKRDHEEQPE